MKKLSIIIGQRIRNYRKNLKLSQEQLAEMASCHHTYIGQVERGEKNATIDSLEKISTALNVPLSTLFEKIEPDTVQTNNYPLQCYELISSKSVEQQKNIFEILNVIDNLTP